MTQYSPKQLLPLAQRTGRWVVKTIKGQATLYTTNLGSTIRFNITGALSFDLQTVNNGHPGFPHQVYAWRYDQQPWQRFQVQGPSISLQRGTATLMRFGRARRVLPLTALLLTAGS